MGKTIVFDSNHQRSWWSGRWRLWRRSILHMV